LAPGSAYAKFSHQRQFGLIKYSDSYLCCSGLAAVDAHTSGVFVVDELYLLNSWFDKIF
jgi:hypothetical protein